MAGQRGKFVWYELMTTDPKAAQSFYGSVVGWGTQDAGMADMSYTMFKAGEMPVAGLMGLPKDAAERGARPGWIGYVAVDDVDAAAAKVKAAGGLVHHAPTDVPNVGRFAVVADPQHAVLALFKGALGEQPPAAAPNTPGHAGWHELYTTDLDAAVAFYGEIFGWTKAEAMDMGPMGVYQIFAVNGQAIGGMMRKPEQVPAPFWNYYFNVDGIDAAVERVKSAKGQVVNGPHQVPGDAWIVQGLDPQGAVFALLASRR